jgi:homotetrameric cytidine deaminase
MSVQIPKSRVDEAWKTACLAYERAHAPYSRFRVGAALKIKGQDALIAGCNVENASYGATVCAERVAMMSAQAQYGAFEPEYLVLVTDTNPAVSPCAMCLQVFSEFCDPDFPIFLANRQGVQEQVLFRDLLARPFEKTQLPSKKA